MMASPAAKKQTMDAVHTEQVNSDKVYYAFACLAQDWNLHHFNTHVMEKGYRAYTTS
jgi:hypothetical protein